jgi:hypothetical protein
MSFILEPDIHDPNLPIEEIFDRFRRYDEFLESIREKLPVGARAYAFSVWRVWNDRHPHDAWFEEMALKVASSGKRHTRRKLDIHVRLLGPAHNGFIEFHYKRVYDYSLVSVHEWMYDEVRLSEEGHVVHEIRFDANSRWLIECKDFNYKWKPFK